MFATALIDTGADRTLIPRKLAEELGIETDGEEWVKMGNGPVKIPYGGVEMTLMGHWAYEKAWISDKVDKVLIGVLALENLGLKVNPKKGILEEEEQALYVSSNRIQANV
ncbi:MAG: retroviral-like aspartic protease family protein [Candidatus Micrarchaeota archaeon]|nr:retroviral-like aspartic protease family protein [Candidatus Micrarchaeota archaeon]